MILAKYKEVSEQAGITNNVLSFGLGLAVSDFNQDGWLDLLCINSFNSELGLSVLQQ
ncbi:MAG: FG-GAP repeat protein [Saprospiraceae bacterium]|nr:FG-GAP repeat protein [Saprospiraceae bacterium]